MGYQKSHKLDRILDIEKEPTPFSRAVSRRLNGWKYLYLEYANQNLLVTGFRDYDCIRYVNTKRQKARMNEGYSAIRAHAKRILKSRK